MLFLVLYELFISFYTHKRALFVGDTVRPGGVISYYLNKRKLMKTISNVDRVDVYRWDKPDLRISYFGEDLQQIVEAIRESHQDNRVYDTPVGVYQMEFYQKNNKLATIGIASNLFVFEGKQYRVPKNAFLKLVDIPLNKLQARTRSK